jgi:thioredoxin 1
MRVVTGFLALVIAAMMIAIAGMPPNIADAAGTPTRIDPKRATQTASANSALPTGTAVRSALVSPTPDIPEPLLAQTQLSERFNAQPTITPGPGELALNGRPHFVEFFAFWCGPCWDQKPFVDEMKELYGDQVNFWYVDIDNPGSRPLNREYRVQFVPYVVLLNAEGELVGTLEGLQTRDTIEEAVLSLLEDQAAPTPTPRR